MSKPKLHYTEIVPFEETASRTAPRFEFEFRVSPITGRIVAHLPYIAVSDIHWGSEASRAKRFCRAFRDFESDRFDIVGDAIGGTELQDQYDWHEHMGIWHRQGIGLVVRKTQTSKVNAMVGNHEANLERLLRKPIEIFGINLCINTEYVDPKERWLLVEHGHRHDLKVFKTIEEQESAYRWGTRAYVFGSKVDTFLQDKLGFENASPSNVVKRRIKHHLNNGMGILEEMAKSIDASAYDGNVSGHSHMGGFHVTAGGKLLINDDSCTDHIGFSGHDRYGNWAVFQHRNDHMVVTMESGLRYSLDYKKMGMPHFCDAPTIIEDEYTARADRLLAIAYRLWPSKDRSRIASIDGAIEAIIKHPDGHSPGSLKALAALEKQYEAVQAHIMQPYPRARGPRTAQGAFTEIGLPQRHDSRRSPALQ